MQESLVDVAQEHRLSLAGMGFGRLPVGITSGHSGAAQQDDLIVFGSLVSNKQEKEVSRPVIAPNSAWNSLSTHNIV